MSVLTPNMSLIQSTIGVDTGLSWEQNLNGSLNVLDGHNHTPGNGIQINPDGLNINASLPFNSNAATSLAYVGFSAQGGSVPTPIDLSVYSSGGELYYQDGSGNNVQITASGVVNATSSGISSGTATASFVSSILVVHQSVGVGAAIDAASYILRYNGSYPSPSGNYIVLAAPAALSGGYQITFPAAAPVSSGSFLTESTAGALSYTNVDNSTITLGGGTIQVPTGGITATQIADQTITQGKLALRSTGTTVSAGGIAIATGSGSYSSTATTSTQVTNQTITITTTGRPVQVMLQASSTASGVGGSIGVTGSVGNLIAVFQIFNGSTLLTQTQVSGVLGDVSNSMLVPAGSVMVLDTPAAGTYTYHLFAFANSGHAGETTLVSNCSLVAYEI